MNDDEVMVAPAAPAAPPTPPAPPARRLGRDQILREAVRFIDQNGRERLTMRRLGAELGVEAMALYRYIPGREQLLDGVVEYVLNELFESTVVDKSVESWQAYLQQLAHETRAMARRHPRIFPLIATRPPSAPWLRPPLRSLRWVEAFLSGLRGFGFGDHASVLVYRAFSTFLLGHLLLEVGDGAAEEMASDHDIEFYESNDLATYPRVNELSGELSQDAYDDEFEDSLEDLINRMDLLRI